MRFLIRLLSPAGVVMDEVEVTGRVALIDQLRFLRWEDMAPGSRVEVIAREEHGV